MSKISINKVSTLPGTPKPNAFYFLPATVGGITSAEFYITDQAGNYHAINSEALMEELVSTLRGANNGIAALDSAGKVPVSQLPAGIGIDFQIASNIAARNALNPSSNILCLVLDASADATVTAGNALYAYELGTTTWHKLSEFESLDLTGLMTNFKIQANGGTQQTIVEGDIINFVAGSANITITRSGKTLTFDVAGGAAHSHSNLSVLNNLGLDGDGDLTYNANPVMKFETNDW